jgi:hypothetical protein
MIKAVITTSLATVMSAAAAFGQTKSTSDPQSSPLLGAWRVAEITRDSAGMRVTRPAQPGIYLFTQTHYSVTRVDSNAPRREFPAELRRTTVTYVDIWGPFTAHAGTYDVAGDVLTTRPVVAKNPSAMQPGAFGKYRLRMVADTLWLGQVATHAGKVAEPLQVKLVRADR